MPRTTSVKAADGLKSHASAQEQQATQEKERQQSHIEAQFHTRPRAEDERDPNAGEKAGIHDEYDDCDTQLQGDGLREWPSDGKRDALAEEFKEGYTLNPDPQKKNLYEENYIPQDEEWPWDGEPFDLEGEEGFELVSTRGGSGREEGMLSCEEGWSGLRRWLGRDGTT